MTLAVWIYLRMTGTTRTAALSYHAPEFPGLWEKNLNSCAHVITSVVIYYTLRGSPLWSFITPCAHAILRQTPVENPKRWLCLFVVLKQTKVSYTVGQQEKLIGMYCRVLVWFIKNFSFSHFSFSPSLNLISLSSEAKETEEPYSQKRLVKWSTVHINTFDCVTSGLSFLISYWRLSFQPSSCNYMYCLGLFQCDSILLFLSAGQCGRDVVVQTIMPIALASAQEVCVWVVPGWLCWDEHATAPNLCHPPWCHLIAGVRQRESKGQRQAGTWRVKGYTRSCTLRVTGCFYPIKCVIYLYVEVLLAMAAAATSISDIKKLWIMKRRY